MDDNGLPRGLQMEEYFQLFDDRAKGAVSDEEVVNRFGRTVLELFQMRRLLISYDADTMEMLHPQGVNPGSELEEMRVRWDEVPESSSVTTRGEVGLCGPCSPGRLRPWCVSDPGMAGIKKELKKTLSP